MVEYNLANKMEEQFTKSYVKVDRTHSDMNMRDITECLREYAVTKSDVEAFVFASTSGERQSVTWSELYHRSCTTAKSMIALGIKRKEIVAMNLRTCPEWLYGTFGAMLAGAIPVSISFAYTDGRDVVAMMEKLQYCSVLVMDPGHGNTQWEIFRKLIDEYAADGTVKSTNIPYLRHMFGVGFDSVTVKPFQDIIEGHYEDIVLPNVNPDDIAIMLQTSGSTGAAKLVAHTHKSMLTLVGTDLKLIDNNYVIYNDRPFNWIGGFPISVFTGQRRVTVSGFGEAPLNNISFMLDIIQKEECTMVMALPPMIAELIRRQDELSSDWPVVCIITGGQPLTESLTNCIGKVTKFLVCLYGGSEALFVTQAVITVPGNYTQNGCGYPIQMQGLEIKVVDEDEQVVNVNTSGEIYIRSHSLFREYYNDPEKTKATKTNAGWFKTDDRGQITMNGELIIEGRKSNMIISGTMKINPEDLERVMRSLPGVDSVIVVPVPDDTYNQVVCACVIRAPGNDVTEEQLRKSYEDLYANAAVFPVLPKFYFFVEKFPQTNTGKINRKEIEKLACYQFK